MKFSVLLPTRNRLELLRYAVETVRRQDYSDWEIIVSDNCSEQDIGGFVDSLNEPRIKYYRTDQFVPVTDNWNNALEKSTGDFVVMLGDDDALMRRYFSTIRHLIQSHGKPDFVYTNALLYAYPGVIPGSPDGFLQPIGYANFLRSATEPFWLDRGQALQAVRDSVNFRMSFGYNMQYAAVSRELIDRLGRDGPFFQSPYPDFYAMNMMMLNAERILVCPYPLIAIGISPKSFGYYYFNRQEQKGTEFLKNFPDAELSRRLKDIILPGTDMNTSWLVAMETVCMNGGSQAGLRVNYHRYRLLQIIRVYAWFALDREAGAPVVRELWDRLGVLEKLLGMVCWLVAVMAWLLPRLRREQAVNLLFVATGISISYFPKKIPGRYRNILEVHELVDPRSSAVRFLKA
jgi:glycosyltransferase involved in cell wall biosynthesis